MPDDSSLIAQSIAESNSGTYDSDSSENEMSPVEAANFLVDRLCSSVAKSINVLLKLSVTFRNPVPIERYQKAKKIDMRNWAQRDQEYVDQKFPNMKKFLNARLVQAILARRRFLAYCKEHHFKLARGLSNDLKEVGAYSSEGLGSSQGAESVSETTASRVPAIEDGTENSSRGRLFPSKGRDSDKHSMTSYSSNSGDPSRPKIPLPPVYLEDGPFPCPYCYLYIEPSTKVDWR